MGHDVQKRQREQRQPALHDHEAHLGDGRPGQRCLHRGLGQHDHPGEHGGEPANHHEASQCRRRQQHDIGKADQQEAAGIDDPCMQQRRHRRRGLHDLGQPTVSWKLGRFDHGGDRQQQRRAAGGIATAAGTSRSDDRADVGRAIGHRQQQRCNHQHGIAQTGKYQLLARCPPRGRTVLIEEQQPRQPQADRDPRRNQQHEIAGNDEQDDARKRDTQPGHEAALPRLAIKIGAGKANDDPANEADKQKHDRAYRIEPDREADAVETDQRAGSGARHNEQGGGAEGAHQ